VQSLSPGQQERYARHLILDGFGGEGQERLLEAAVHVRGGGPAALWAARYLAASGVGKLAVDVPGWRDELQKLGPWLSFVDEAPLTVEPEGGPIDGASAAVEVVRKIVR
jgi:molybdopterin/thiamine biosynthesis adenylyltransferase